MKNKYLEFSTTMDINKMTIQQIESLFDQLWPGGIATNGLNDWTSA